MDPEMVGAPVQIDMGGQDIFRNSQKIMVKQEFAMLEMCSCEAKNRYSVTQPNGESAGPDIFLYLDEDSQCLERICCSVNRSLTLNVHAGKDKDGNIVQSMYKPFHLQGCCFCRPRFEVFAGPKGQNQIGSIEDPCRCCMMDQQIKNTAGDTIFTTYGSICQLGMCCPCCASVDFDVLQKGNSVGTISKRPMTCGECCKKTNRFTVDFPKNASTTDRRLIFAASMLLDLEYFEQNKNKD